MELRAEDFTPHPTGTASRPTYGLPQELWLDTGRSALAVVARHVSATCPGGCVWLPAYCCESVAAPFLAAGLRVNFYGVGDRLKCLDADPKSGDTLLFIHYFGWRNARAAAVAEGFRKRGVRLIEDCAQAAFSRDLGRDGDHVLTSLRKLLPQPDGALLASRETIAVEPREADERFVSARVAGKLLRGTNAPANAFLPWLEDAESRLASDCPRAMSWVAGKLLERADLASAASQRRANFDVLARGMANLGPKLDLELLHDTIDAATVPLGMPVVVNGGRRDALRRHLASHGIFCAVHWDLSHLPGDGFAAERALSTALLTLPLDQRYSEHHMRLILETLATFSETRL